MCERTLTSLLVDCFHSYPAGLKTFTSQVPKKMERWRPLFSLLCFSNEAYLNLLKKFYANQLISTILVDFIVIVVLLVVLFIKFH